MIHRVVYVLSCGDSSFYPEQCLMSLHTLKKFNSDISACVVMDEQTLHFLTKPQYDALGQCADIISIPIPSEFGTERLRSRYMKTSLRSLVNGDFVFLDCDTLICRPFTDSDFCDIMIGMVADLNAPLPLSNLGVLQKCQKAGFTSLQGAPYFNSGFFFVKDNPVTHHFFDIWHQLWQESVRNGITFDQPALCEANRRLGFPIKVVSGIWNCQIKFKESRRFLRDAIVLHYFAANGSAGYSLQEEALLKKIRIDGIDSVVDSILSGSAEAITAFFCQKTDSALRFLGTEMFSIFSEDSPTFRIAERFAGFIRKMKQVGRSFWGGRNDTEL